MPRMTGQNLSVAANATTTNQLSGLSFEFLEMDAHIVFAACAAAVGINCSLLVAGGVTAIDDMPISQANRFPTIPDDIAYEDDVPAGRMILRFRNTTGAAIIVPGWLLDVTF